jgi:hypothetical protein
MFIAVIEADAPTASRPGGSAGSAFISLNARGCRLLTTSEKKNFSYHKISFVSERIRLGISKETFLGRPFYLFFNVS